MDMGTHSNQQAAPITVHSPIQYKSYIDMKVVTHTGDYVQVK